MLPEQELNEIYDILAKETGADDSIYNRTSFLKEHSQKNFPSELRICTKLGFGGKFKRSFSRVWVSQYPETATKESLELEKKVNEKLKKYWKQ